MSRAASSKAARTGFRAISQPTSARPDGRSSPCSPPAIDPPGPGVSSPVAAAVGDRRSDIDVGADFFSAAELAQLRLDGLPDRREHIARRATHEKWAHRLRQGRGGGREFPLQALPARARGDLLKRRLERDALAATGNAGVAVAPLADLATLRSKQAERFAARSALLDAFDAMRANSTGKLKSARSTMPMFLRAWAEGQVELPEWTRPLLGERLSAKTLKRWLAARNSGTTEALAGRWPGVASVFDRSAELSDFIVGAHVKQPALSARMLDALMRQQFPEGAPDERGVLLALPSHQSIGRFLREWKGNPANALALAAVNDPDGYRSKFRVAFGRAGSDVVRPNQHWQIDASPADVLCIDGRNTIYVVVDVFSRRMLALVSKTPRTAASLLLIARACQAWGVPELLLTDNGSDFKSKHFVLAIRQLGIEQKRTRPYSPEHKGFVERGIGTVQHSFMPLIEGYVGHNVATRAEIAARTAFAHRLGESEDKLMKVSITAAELQERISGWIANVYEKSPHAGLDKRAPIDVWSEGVAQHPQRFAHPRAVGALLMPPAQGGGTRIVGRKGVSVDSIDYVNATMMVGQRVQVRLDPEDLGTIWLYTDADPWEFLGVAENVELKGLDRAAMAAKARAIQDSFAKQARAELRRVANRSNVYDLAARMMRGDDAPAPAPVVEITHTTPALDQAERAIASRDPMGRGRREIPEISDAEREAHRDFVATFDEAPAREETSGERFDRWLHLKAMHDRGEPIPGELLHWFNDYPTTGEWRGQRLARGHDDGDPL